MIIKTLNIQSFATVGLSGLVPGISLGNAGVRQSPVLAAVEGEGLALAGGDDRVEAAATQGVGVDASF